jgi:hypothetical protein
MKKKDNRGGFRPGAGPPKKEIIKKTYSVVLYPDKANFIKAKFGTLSKALDYIANNT